MENIYHKEDIVNILNINKKMSELTLEDLDRIYKNRIIILFKFITDDDYFIKLEKETESC